MYVSMDTRPPNRERIFALSMIYHGIDTTNDFENSTDLRPESLLQAKDESEIIDGVSISIGYFSLTMTDACSYISRRVKNLK